MLLTGIFYTLIGIKTKWLHISLSSAYLVSLGITVLIIYVMHPPVSNALQGVYVMAVALSGILLGAGSIIFKDVTEGFGCFIGGFCLSMWFLVLKPGGLIGNDIGKAVFILCFTVGAYALYLSHYTRPYGLIGSTSFAGATITVLGIDCFSRAGLKEFWVYIWSMFFPYRLILTLLTTCSGLNDNVFPPHYHQAYPHTRGIRVEIAAIVIITLLGVMSQMKVWKIVKQKREERATEQQKKEHQRNLSDEERGRKVESEAQQDRPLWEALHHNKDKTKVGEGYLDSGIGTEAPSSTRQSSVGNTRSSNDEGMELQNLPKHSHGSEEAGRVTVYVAQDDFYEVSLADGQRSSMEQAVLGPYTNPPSAPKSGSSSMKETAKTTPKVVDPNLTLQPKVVPPPFKIPGLDSASDDDGSSIEASAPSDYLPNRGSRRYSGSSVMNRLSNLSRHRYVASATSEEALMVLHVEDDRASSLAATADGISEHGDSDEDLNYSRSHTPVIENILDGASLDALEAASHKKDGSAFKLNLIDSTEANSTYQGPEILALPSSPTGSNDEERLALEQSRKGSNPMSTATSETSAQRAERVRLSGNLPGGGSKVVTAYRTNEWAKHLGTADVPEYDELKVKPKPLPKQQSQGEAAAPLDVRALQQTPLNAEPAPAVTSPVKNSSHADLPSSKPRSSNLMSRNLFSRRTKDQEQPPKVQPVLHPLTIAKNVERNPSQTSLAKTVSRNSSQGSLTSNGETQHPLLPRIRSSQTSLPGTSRAQRNSSAPLASPLVESPIEEGVESSFPSTRFTPHNAHLMSQRDRIISSKPSSTSLLRTSYSNVALDQHPAYRTIAEDDDYDENIPLSHRKSLLQQNPQPTNPQSRRSSSGPISGTATPHYPSGTTAPIRHISSPHRSSSTPQLAHPSMPTQRDSIPHNPTVSAWRTSLQPSTTAHYENQTMEVRRADLMREKVRESTSRLEGQMKQGARMSAIDQGMRRGDMMDAHKNAMRKLQGEARV